MQFARSFLENACFWKLGPTLSPSRRVCGRVVVEDDDSSESGGNLINSPAPCRGIRVTMQLTTHKNISSTLKTGKVQLARFPKRAWNPGMIPWFDVSRSQLSSYPSGPTQRCEPLYVHNPGAFPVRLRPIRSMTSVTVRSAMISLTFCFWSIACTSCRTETESPTLRGCENRTATAYKHFTQNSY